MPIKPHPTDPDKMVYVKREYNLPKEWVGLTDEERNFLAWESNNGIHCVQMTEAKLKEKNG